MLQMHENFSRDRMSRKLTNPYMLWFEDINWVQSIRPPFPIGTPWVMVFKSFKS